MVVCVASWAGVGGKERERPKSNPFIMEMNTFLDLMLLIVYNERSSAVSQMLHSSVN